MVSDPAADPELRALLKEINGPPDDLPSGPIPLADEHATQLADMIKLMSARPELAAQLAHAMDRDNADPSSATPSPLAALASVLPAALKTGSAKESKERFEIIPEPGFVLKTTNKKKVGEWPEGIKVFVNVCHSPHIPAPPPASDEEVLEAINAGDRESYRLPTSLSAPRRDTDKVGRECCVFDVCVHTNALQMASRLEDYQTFLMQMILQYIEEKSKMQLSGISFPKMRSKGRLAKHIIYRPKRPMVVENAPVLSNQKTATPPLAAKSKQKTLPAPTYELIPTPLGGRPQNLLVKVYLPTVESTKDAELDLEPDKLFLHVPNTHDLSVALPWIIDIHNATAEFDRNVRQLNVYMTCT
ncbi:hypothetical protein SeMB42_g04369 [Synchytrium endobioticum]|uniref:PIH1 domain-containing protein 1 n=1 Tax=Synchytrium endobioticum TaxID=286115 RepID=A0A507CW93_9FUNG|nr:hypothetical protein SeLEV6574_g05073 [Synchytrium endobioticum]TPX44369.1 hypothetical protein SeMB42_g04369 [Synchytrium endobioticum]